MFHVFDIFAGFGLIAGVLGILATIFWIWMLIDCIQNGRLQSTEKIVWVLVILFLHFLGALIYYFVGREQRI
jgi:hypothetical protein